MAAESTPLQIEERPTLDDIFSPNHYEKLNEWSGEKIAWELIRHHKKYRDLYKKYREQPDEAQNCEYKGDKKVIPDDMSMEFFLSRNKKRLSEIAKVMTYGEYCDKYTAGKRIKLKSCLYRDLRVYKLRAFFDYNLSYEQIMASVGKNVRIFTPPHIVDQSGVYGVTSKKMKPNELMVVIDLSRELTEQFKSAQAFLREVVKELKSEDVNYVRRKMKVENPLVIGKARFDVYAVGKALRFAKARCLGYRNTDMVESWQNSKFRLIKEIKDDKKKDEVKFISESDISREIGKVEEYLPDGKTGKFKALLMLSVINKVKVDKLKQ